MGWERFVASVEEAEGLAMLADFDYLDHLQTQYLRAAERRRGGKDPNASAAIMDSQSIKTTEEGGGSNGYDVHKNVKARKRHLLVDTLGMPLSICVTPADVQDRAGALLLVARRSR